MHVTPLLKVLATGLKLVYIAIYHGNKQFKPPIYYFVELQAYDSSVLGHSGGVAT